MKSTVIFPPLKMLFGQSSQENQIRGACGMYGEEEKRIHGFDGET